MFRNISFFIFLIFLSGNLTAQINESFDNDLSNWSGNTDHFIINNQDQLQLNAIESGQSILYQKSHIPDSCNWEIDIQLNFPPSGSNRVRCFLQALDTTGQNGYAVEWGISGDRDAIQFVKYLNGAALPLGTMSEGEVAREPSIARIAAQRNGNEWILRAAYSFGGAYTDSLIVDDTSFGPAADQFFLIECTYTATRTDKFLFDDIFVGRKNPDQTPPEIIGTRWKQDTLVIEFNEIVLTDFAEAEWVSDPSVALSLIREEPSDVLKILPSDGLQFGAQYELIISGVSDLSANEISPTVIPFVYDPITGPKPFELLISEIMAAPSEETALPNVEYVELVSRASRSIELNGLLFTDGNRTARLPGFILSPGEYVILCAISDSSELSIFDPLLPVENFPGLNNAGDNLKLQNQSGQLIHAVNYSESWYADPSKDDGGWSLELIDTAFACLQSNAYRASNDPRGGSPGSPNSLSAGEYSDPQIIEVDILSPEQFVIQFDQWISSEIPSIEEAIQLMPDQNIEFLRIPEEEPNQMEVILSSPLEVGTNYKFTLSPSLKNCLGQAFDLALNSEVGISEEPDSGQLIISEIMFDPASGGAQWVELYNPTDKIFSWKDLYLSFRASDLSDQVGLAGDDLILPGRYYVLTEDPTYVVNNFNVPYPNQLRTQQLPRMDRNRGQLRLEYITNTESLILEESCYDEDWHSGFTRTTKGVSLERLSLNMPACSKENWQSAAETSGFATPTGKNSQQIEEQNADTLERFLLLSPTFSPDGDGFEDQMVFRYTNTALEAPPQLDLFVYSLHGILVKTLANNLSVGQQDQFLWDGTDENGLQMTEGYYLIKARTYSDSGRVNHWQATVYLIYPD